MPQEKTPRIIIAGAGFVGLPVARRLARAGLHVTLVDPKGFFLFLPRLIDALADPTADRSRFTCDLAELASRDGFTFIRGRVVTVDRTGRTIQIERPDGTPEQLSYDYAVISPGSVTNDFGVPGAEAHGLPLKTLDDVDRIHAKLRSALESHSTFPQTGKGRRPSFIVVGGGASGVEAVFALKSATRALQGRHAPGLRNEPEFTLIQAAPQILPGFPGKLVTAARRAMHDERIMLREGDPVVTLRDGFVDLGSGHVLPADAVLWVAGVLPAWIDIDPDVARDQQECLVTDATLRIEERISTGGDVAVFRDRNMTIPKNAQTSMRKAVTIADNILRHINAQPLKPFHYSSKGNILTLGSTGVMELGPFRFSSRFTGRVRDFFYTHRMRQLCG